MKNSTDSELVRLRVLTQEYKEFLSGNNYREMSADELLIEIKKVDGVNEDHIAYLENFIARWESGYDQGG